jgi:hypothetical protein
MVKTVCNIPGLYIQCLLIGIVYTFRTLWSLQWRQKKLRIFGSFSRKLDRRMFVRLRPKCTKLIAFQSVQEYSHAFKAAEPDKQREDDSVQ